jgi:hypothetical protein
VADNREGGPRLPPRFIIRLAWSTHRAIYRVTGGRVGLWRPKPGRWGTLRLTTTGRRSGRPRSVIVGYVRIAWGFSVPYLVRALDRRPAQRVRRVGAPRRFLVADTIRRNSIQDVRIDDHLRIGRGRRGEHARHTTAAILRPGGPPAITRSG